MRLNFVDAQQALGFLISQTTHIEAQVYRTQYPDIQYPNLVPVDSSANEWARSVTYFSMDRVGKAKWLSNGGGDIPYADVNRMKGETQIEMAGIGYEYAIDELGYAALVPGSNLSAERAMAARRAYEEFVEVVAFTGDADKNWKGLINYTGINRVDAAGTGAGNSTYWADKTADQIVQDINDALQGIYSGTKTVEMADTVLLPIDGMALLANSRVPNTMASALDFITKYNVYTAQTGQALTIRGVLGLENAGNSNKGRMVCYRKDPSVLKMHIPMPHRFLPVWQRNALSFEVPGIFRLGGLEIRRPKAVTYVDGITPAS
jgi:hypothetical protein